MGQADGRGLERRSPRRADQGAGDPCRRLQRGDHRRGDHRGQRAVPRLQHVTRRGARLPEAGWPRQPVAVRGRRRLHHRAFGRSGRPVPVERRRLLPDAVEVEPGDDLLQQGHVRAGGPRPRQPAARHVRRVPGDLAHARVLRCGEARDLAGTDERVLPELVRLLPAVRGPVGRHPAARGREGDVQRRERRGRRRLLGDDLRRGARGQGGLQRRRVRRPAVGDVDRGALGDRGLRRQRQLGLGPGSDAGRHGCLRGVHVQRREEHRHVHRVRQPGDGVGRPEVLDE